MRPIDADALLDRIRNPYEQAEVARWVNEQPTVNQWIPCSERLPEIGQYVICQCRAGIIDVLALDNDGIWFHDTEQEYYHDYVIAWMPLPECYRGDENVK